MTAATTVVREIDGDAPVPPRGWWWRTGDRFLASDPGLTRLIMAGRAVLAMASALGLEYLLALATGQSPLVPMMLGAVLAMLAAFGVLDPTRGGQAITICCMPFFMLAGMGLALLVDRNRTLSLASFVLVVFIAVYIRRFGPRYFTCGFVVFMGYFFALFLGLRPEQLSSVLPPIALATVWILLLTLVLLPIRNDRVLRRMVRSFEARLSAVAAAAEQVLACAPGTPERDAASTRLSSRLVRSNETALVIDGQLGAPGAVADDDRARTLRRAVFDGELAVAAIAQTVARLAERADRDGSAGARSAIELMSALRQGRWDRLRTLADDLAAELDASGSPLLRGLAAETLVLLTVRAEWAQALARGAGDAAAVGGFEPAVQLFAGALPGSADTVRRMHEPPAEPTPDEPVPAGPVTGTDRPSRFGPMLLTTRQAIQVAIATAGAIAVGDALSEQRYYWAVLAAFIAFTGTATVAETITKAVNRTVGTMVGILGAVALVPLLGSNPAVALPVILFSIFAAFYVFRISYALMIFFITMMLAEFYSLLGSFTTGLMVLRLEETAVGGLIGCAVSMLVLPTRTRAAAEEAQRGLFTVLRDLIGTVDRVLRGHGGSDDLNAVARRLDASYHQALLVSRPLSRTWMYAPNPSGRRRLTAYTALAHHARHLARAVNRLPCADLAATARDDLAVLTGACARMEELAGRRVDGSGPRPGAFTAVADLLVPVAGSTRALAPLAREAGLLAAELEALLDGDDLVQDRDTSGDEPGATVVTGRVCGPDLEPATATVTAVDRAGRQDARTVTDADGRFTLALTAAGTYLLVVAPSVTAAAAPHGEYVRLRDRTVLPDVRLPSAPAAAVPAPRRAGAGVVVTDLPRVRNGRPTSDEPRRLRPRDERNSA